MATAESPEFVGKAVVALAADSKKLTKTSRIHITGDLASEYGFSDKNGELINIFVITLITKLILLGVIPSNFRSVRSALQFLGWVTIAKLFPRFLKVPKWVLHFSSYKF